MSNQIVSTAKWGEQPELASLWSVCFQEPPRAVKYFFNNAFRPKNCLTYRVDSKIVAMVHMLPAKIYFQGCLRQAHYIYAAATLPQFRRKGYMETLLNGAAYVGSKRGDLFSFLLPANQALYQYYAKAGYIAQFEARNLTLEHSELERAAHGCQSGKILLDYFQMQKIRINQLSSLAGSIIWDAPAISYADGINRFYGGKIVGSCINNRQAYAVCSKVLDGVCLISEMMADENTFPNLAANILVQVPAKQYHVRLPNDNKIFREQGKVARFGMIKPLGNCPLDLLGKGYLGLTLD